MIMRTTILRTLIGFLLAPALPALALYLINLNVVSRHEAILPAVILVVLGYVAALTIGVPLHLLLKRRGVHSLKAYLFFGALVGLIFYLLFFGIWGLLSYQSYPDHALLLIKNSATSGLTAIAYSAVASTVFWLVAVRVHRA
jgi:heme/copper-type cytochrome/quinol oxidase subunit 4